MKIPGPLIAFVGIVLSLGLIAGLWFVFTGPKVEAYNTAVEERDDYLAKVSYFDEKITQIGNGQDYLGQLYSQAQTVDNLLPAQIPVGDIVIEYPAMAQSYGLTFIDISKPTGEESTSKSYTMTVEGDYASLASWLQALENAPNLVTVNSLDIKAQEGTYNAVVGLSFHTSSKADLQSK